MSAIDQPASHQQPGPARPVRLTVPLPTATPPPERRWIGTFFIAIGFLCLGMVGGYLGHRHFDQLGQYDRYAAELEPLLYYKDRLHAGAERGSNETMRLVNFKVYQAAQDGLNIRKLLDLAQPRRKHPPVLTRLTNTRLIKNLELGRKYGIYEGAENLEALAYRKSPKATKGEYAGERMDVEHLIPKAIAPSLDNILANLMWLPAPLNQSKSDTITAEAMVKGVRWLPIGKQ